MHRSDRYALIYDHPDSRLGSAALALLERGIDTLYANDPDEALLLARQERHRIGALVVPGTIELGTLDALLERVVNGLPGGLAAVIAVGPSLEQRTHLGALRERRIGWVLRAPYEASDLRFVVSAALTTDSRPSSAPKGRVAPA
jgi:hypothetical protein